MTPRAEIRALTVRQPFATLLAIGAKRVETRGRRISYRGWLMIHAGKGYTDEERELSRLYPFGNVLAPGVPLTLGAVVAVGELVDCVESAQLERAFRDTDLFPEHERDFGHYGPGRFGWVLSNVTALIHPVPASGQQGLWVPDEQLRAAVREELANTRAITKGRRDDDRCDSCGAGSHVSPCVLCARAS